MADTTEQPKFYTVEEVAERLGISRALAYRMVAEGKIPSVKLTDSKRPLRRIPVDAFEAWLTKRTQGGT